MATENTLTGKQLAFVSAYLTNGFNGRQAAIAAGYSEETATEMAYENLRKPHIKKYIEEHRKKMEQKTSITVEKVIAELAKVGFSNIQDFITADNELRDVSKIKRSKAAAVSSIKRKKRTYYPEEGDPITTEEVEIKLHSKLSALDMIMRHVGGYATVQDLVDKMDDQQKEELLQQLLNKLNHE
jgi:phage terminase small subunit